MTRVAGARSGDPVAQLGSTSLRLPHLHTRASAEEQRAAADVVLANARDVDDSRLLLDILGLGPDQP